ncbi:MAG TPA: thioredoxin [Anaerolineae bacterium]|nr:thioredoxin [Anaerolineae bacterium]HIQ05874.1 thioredoxin [Anaerolineae bacterium]
MKESGDEPVYVDGETLEQMVLRSSTRALVVFWAPWCEPCRHMAPILDRLAREFTGRLQVLKVNADDNPHIVTDFNVRAIPTMLLVHNGQVVSRIVGTRPYTALKTVIEQSLLK